LKGKRKMCAEVKRMAELLKAGAAMLSDVCPECGTPLFKMGEEIFCPKCNRPVVRVKSSEDERKMVAEHVLANTEQTILTKIRETDESIKRETDPEKLIQLGNALSGWLTALERIRRLKGMPS